MLLVNRRQWLHRRLLPDWRPLGTGKRGNSEGACYHAQVPKPSLELYRAEAWSRGGTGRCARGMGYETTFSEAWLSGAVAGSRRTLHPE
jgi:hypothetical protein